MSTAAVNLTNRSQSVKYTISATDPTASARTTMTSRRKYWYQARSSRAERKCGAPLCRITYSVQYTAFSSGVSGWCLKIWERRAFSRYLWQPPNITAQIWNNISSSRC